MAEFADMGDATERYAAIERAYCDDRWPVVIDQGGRLLSQLGPEDGGLRQRLQLLMAHSYLYGFGERDAAEDLYRAVLESKAEASLRQIAAQGLEQCDKPPQPAGSPAIAAWSPDPAPVAPPQPPLKPEDLPQPASAPSLEDDGGPSLHDSVQALIPSVPPQAPPPQGGTPVMPWLETGSAAAGGTAPASTAGATAGPGTPANLPWERPPQPSESTRGPRPPERIEAELIDEPELVEVHQADPRLAEEIDLLDMASLAASPPPGDPPDAPGELEPPMEQEPPADLETPTLTATPADPLATAASLLELEDDGLADDAELRRGLLRVEIL